MHKQCVFTFEPQRKGVEYCIWKIRIGHWEGRYELGFVHKTDPRVCVCVCVSVFSNINYKSINVLVARCRI